MSAVMEPETGTEAIGVVVVDDSIHYNVSSLAETMQDFCGFFYLTPTVYEAPVMHKENMNTLADFVQDHGNDLNMASWHSSEVDFFFSRLFPESVMSRLPCRETHCIGGFAEILFNGTKTDSAGIVAQHKLGLDFNQCNNLFHLSQWPQPFQTEYIEALQHNDRPATGKIAANRIRYMVATGE